MDIEKKLNKLTLLIKNLGSAAVAFSGGVDSSLLLKVCYDTLQENALAITVASPLIPKAEIEEASVLAKAIGIEQLLIKLDNIEEKTSINTVKRCYFCKKVIFSKIVNAANERGIKYILDGSNFDDEKDYRPGMQALDEMKVLSPLRQVKLTKEEIRVLSKRLGLKTWNKPAMACLASRIPYGENITTEKLLRIEKAESYLKSIGLVQYRVRNHGNIARIEVSPKEREKLFNTDLMDSISKKLKLYGFSYVGLELEGYKTGSLNIGVKQKDIKH